MLNAHLFHKYLILRCKQNTMRKNAILKLPFSYKFLFHYLRSQKYKSPLAKSCSFVCQTWQPSFDGTGG